MMLYGGYKDATVAVVHGVTIGQGVLVGVKATVIKRRQGGTQ
ncbi:MAG: hypothetical protein ABFD12_08725 [Syntrophorhabdus sp.]